jgi:hypothetical protein
MAMSRSTEFTRERAGRAGVRSTLERPATVDEGMLGELAHERAVGKSYDEEGGWARAGTFGAGLALGLALGVGTTLLLAPRSGEETRELLGIGARRLGGRVANQWDDLRDELSWLARRGRRRIRRGLTRGRWKAEDVADRGRRVF